MALRRYWAAALLAACLLVTGQDLSSLPSCGQTCFKNMLEGSAPALGCPSDVVSCLCGKPDFKFGISDCATQACGAEVAPTVTNYLAALCATATLATSVTPAATTSSPPQAPETTTTPPSPPPTTSTPEVSSSATPSAEVESKATEGSTTETLVLAPSTSASPVSSSSSESPKPTVTDAAPTPSSTNAGTTSSSSSTTSASSSSTVSSAADVSGESSASNLSMGAIVGISVGGAAVILAAVVLAMIRRHHVKNHKKRSVAYMHQLKISDPMPGSGRSFADSDTSPRRPTLTHSPSELEMRSRRYEDMVPRIAPRLIA